MSEPVEHQLTRHLGPAFGLLGMALRFIGFNRVTKAELRELKAELNKSIADSEKITDQRHQENLARFDELKGLMTSAHGDLEKHRHALNNQLGAIRGPVSVMRTVMVQAKPELAALFQLEEQNRIQSK